MSEIDVCVGNYGYYAEGKLRDRWVELPMEPDELDEFLVLHGLRDGIHEETYISDYDGYPFDITNGMFGETTPLTSLNMLAQIMQDNPDACDKLEAALNTDCECPTTVLGLANWILQADDIPYHTYDMPPGYGLSDDDFNWNYGLTCAYETGLLDDLKHHGAEGCFEFSEYGEMMSNDVTLGKEGYVDMCVELPSEDTYSWKDIEQMMPWNEPQAHRHTGARRR